MSLQVQIEKEGVDTRVVLNGDIDERAMLPSLEIAPEGRLIIDLDNVRMINSNGARSWVNWIRQFEGVPGGIVLEKCHTVVVNQINILVGFMPSNAVVTSFKVPYYCDGCGFEETTMWQQGVQYQESGEFQPPEDKICPSCKGAFAPDCLVQSYFRFLIRKRV